MTNFQFVAVSCEGYRSGPSARLDCSRFFCRCCCWEEVQVLCSGQEWQETEFAISDHETHLYPDQLLYLIPVPDQLVPLLCECFDFKASDHCPICVLVSARAFSRASCAGQRCLTKPATTPLVILSFRSHHWSCLLGAIPLLVKILRPRSA